MHGDFDVNHGESDAYDRFAKRNPLGDFEDFEGAFACDSGSFRSVPERMAIST